MSRTELLLSQEQLRPFDLETFVHEAATLNRCTLETYTRPFPEGVSELLISCQTDRPNS
jgi:hypothetical protein